MNQKRTGYKRGATCIEVLVMVFIIIVLAAVLLPALVGNHEAARRASCANNLKQIGLSLTMYSNEFGKYPSSGYYDLPTVNCTTMDLDDMGASTLVLTNSFNVHQFYLEYLNYDMMPVLVCPSSPVNRLSDFLMETGYEFDAAIGEPFLYNCEDENIGIKILGDNYTYLSHDLTENPQLVTLTPERFPLLHAQLNQYDLQVPESFALYMEHLLVLSEGSADALLNEMDNDLQFEDGTIIRRHAQPVERFATWTDEDEAKRKAWEARRSSIPIMFDNPGTYPAAYNHIPGGSNVLYRDGHVAFVRFDEGRFPVTESVARVYQALELLPEDNPAP